MSWTRSVVTRAVVVYVENSLYSKLEDRDRVKQNCNGGTTAVTQNQCLLGKGSNFQTARQEPQLSKLEPVSLFTNVITGQQCTIEHSHAPQGCITVQLIERLQCYNNSCRQTGRNFGSHIQTDKHFGGEGIPWCSPCSSP